MEENVEMAIKEEDRETEEASSNSQTGEEMARELELAMDQEEEESDTNLENGHPSSLGSGGFPV